MKHKTRLLTVRAISLLLCLLMILFAVPTSVVAEEMVTNDVEETQDMGIPQTLENETSIEQGTTQPNAFALGIGEKSFAELQTMRVEDVARPETISLAVAQEKGHVHRLSAQEDDLQTVIFQNLSGTKTTYIYDRPVKYIDADGTVKDKSSVVGTSSLAGYAYAMEDNSTRVYFAPLASGGVRVTYENYALTMHPESSLLVSSASLGEEANTVLYNGAFGARTVLRYQTNLYGVKEDIILLQNVGKYTFQFRVVATGLTPIKVGENWYFQNEAGERIISLGRIVIKDSAGKTVYGDMNIAQTAQAGVYNLSVQAPQAFLQASDTVYPVYIDPTTTVNETGYYYTYNNGNITLTEYDSIIDLGLYTDELYYDIAESTPGAHILEKDKSKVAYEFYDFWASDGLFASLQYWQIVRANLKFFANCETSFAVDAFPLECIWPSDTYLLNSSLSSSYDEWAVLVSMVGSAGTNVQHVLDITNFAVEWTLFNHWGEYSDYYSPRGGLILSRTDDGDAAFLFATEAEDYNVCLEMEIRPFDGDYFIKNRASGLLLKNNNNASTALSAHTSMMQIEAWTLQNAEDNDKYVIRSLGNLNYALVGDTSPALMAIPTSGYTEAFYWYVTELENGGFVLQNCYSGKYLYYDGSNISLATAFPSATSQTYYQYVWDLMYRDLYHPMEDFEVANTSWLAVGATSTSTILHDYGAHAWDSVTDFTWASSNTAVVTVDQSGNVTAVGNGIAQITATNKLSGESASYRVRIHPTNYLKNKGVELFLQSENLTNGSLVKRVELDSTTQTRWIITPYNNGYFLIKSEYSNMYLCVQNNSSNFGVAITQVSTPSVGCYWKIENTFEYADDLSLDFAYKLRAQCGGEYVLHTSPYMTTCNQAAYTADDNYDDTWVITPALYGSRTFWELDPDSYVNVNCHGYAFDILEKPQIMYDWADPTFYSDTMQTTEGYEAARETYFSDVVYYFECWLQNEGYQYEFEGVYSVINELSPLESDEFRVVLRTGIQPNGEYSEGILYLADYHFWYQTYDGRWAQKNGYKQYLGPFLLHSMNNPSNPGNGWDRPSSWTIDGIVTEYDCDVYDSTIYSYIITMK